MKFEVKNPKFITDMFTMLLSIAVIALTIVVIFNGSRAILAIVFYMGAALFLIKVVRGFMSRRARAILFIIPIALCIAAALMAQGAAPMPELPWS
ncbi:MAG: hypothetical protein IJ827_01590 [Lachnospiraceae bacterium]|nr:hypothetical protein [Lachnospiraceae bacterium]MBR1913501.1 hypothetical protein [Lachnospiraceae bacterium]